MPRPANSQSADSTANLGFDAVARCEVRSAGVEEKTVLPFVIRNSSFDIPFGPACGSGGMFVSSARFVAEHKQNPGAEPSIHGVEKTDETGRLCRRNLN